MDTDERLKWIEARISTSLRPRADELRGIFVRDESRATLIEFFSNDEAHRLFVFFASEDKSGSLKVSLNSPKKIIEKCICFVKTGSASQLHSGNFDDGITCLDWASALPHADMFVRDVFLPLLCTDTELMSNDAGLAITSDKLMDILHRLLGNIEVSRGVAGGNVTLPLPCIEVLAEAAAFEQRQPAVVHVLESAVVGWIRQIKNVLHHDALAATIQISKEENKPIRPLHEIVMWRKYIEHTTSILEQLEAPVASDILMNLSHANSTYAQSFGEVQAEIERALEEAKVRLCCFETLLPWIQDIYRTSSVDKMLKVFPALLHTVMLIWKHSTYYHEPQPFAQLLKMLSNEIVARARSLVGENPFEDTHQSYKALKDALRLCAAFRGTYLDFKETANNYNTAKVESTVITMARLRPKDKNVLFRTRMYGPAGYQDWYNRSSRSENSNDDSGQWVDSPWPPRNNKCFAGLSRFVERCNDLLDLVETTRHFLTLEEAARIGGAGSPALDALISDIHQVFVRTIHDFTSRNRGVLSIDDRHHFEKSFFRYRSVIKTLEHRLAGVLRGAIRLCPNALSHLRVLEVFEGISARQLLQKELQTENHSLVISLTAEFKSVKAMFESSVHDVPHHVNMPPTVCKLVWVRGLKERMSGPMSKIRLVCPHALESDIGWQLRDAYTETMNELEKYEARLLASWAKSVDSDLREKLKQPVLATEQLETTRDSNESRLWNPPSARESMSNVDPDATSETGGEIKGQALPGLKVNLDTRLLEMLRDVHHLQRTPHDVPVPSSVRALLRSVDSSTLQKRATRMRTVVSKYNHIVQRLQEHEQLLFENRLRRVDEIVNEGKEKITWGSADLDDFLEKSSSVICDDVYRVLTRVHNNWDRVKDMSRSWSEGALDIFTSHQLNKQTKSLKQLLEEQEELDDCYRRKLIPDGQAIHQHLRDSFKAVEMSEASPAWQMYTSNMDLMVLMALKTSILTSLDAMYSTIAKLDETGQDAPNDACILEVRLELVEQTVSFSPPLDRSASVDNIEDAVSLWLSSFLKRSMLIQRLMDSSGTYKDFLTSDQDVWEIVDEIRNVVQENATKCKELLSTFDNYKFLWVQDVQQSFRDFLKGRPSPNPLRVSKQSNKRRSYQNRMSTGQRSRFSVTSADDVNEAERNFLTPHTEQQYHNLGNGQDGGVAEGFMVVPGLDDFDDEISIYRTARDNVASLPDKQSVGWLLFDYQPIKQVLTTYASKWMWTFVRYLCDQVTGSLDTLADFLARTEPEIESITGEERDTASFMKMMRLFNEVSAQQQDMDERFSVMQRTVDLLEKYEMKLPNETQEMFRSAPDRWNHLKTKVSLAKQRLGPRIQEESDRITRDLLRFSDRVEALASELRSSEIFSRECPIHTANDVIDGFSRRLKMLQTEAQDLIELQELLETAVVNFSVLPQYQRDLRNSKLVWDHVRMLEEEQGDWKRKHWQKIDTKHLHQAIQKQKDQIQSLPPETTEWDVHSGMIDSIVVIEQCLPLVEDLNHPAMRTRHWKQLVRITGGLLQTDADSLRKMILGDLLELGLQKHTDEVKAIVQRAVKDLTIESSLKTCEEVWLSKIFELRPHTRSQSKNVGPDFDGGSEMTGSELMPHALLQAHEGSKGGGTRTKSMKSGPHSRSSDKTGAGSVSRGRGGGRTSVLSLPVSLLNLVDDPSPICLLKNVEKIFSDLEHHQMELTRMQSNSAIGSFLDELTKWQKRLHLIESVLGAWLNVQTKWVQLDEVYSGADVRTALAHEANMFAVISKDFRLLMRATEKNTNVLQGCSRKGILPMLEKMDTKMEQCRHALLGNLERRRQRFPRFYFLSPEDVMNIVCYSYDLNAVNKYLCKVLPHLGRLIFTEDPVRLNPTPSRLSAGGRKRYRVSGLSSVAGEVMTFRKPLVYEGPMSLWLPQLLMAIQVTLQEHLHVSLGNEARPAQLEQSLRSVGASRVRISRPSSAVSQRSGGSDPVPKVAVSPPVPGASSGSESGKEDQSFSARQPSDIATQLSATLGTPLSQVSWTLDNSTQVVLLATTVQMNERMQSALSALKNGDHLSLVKVADTISDNLHAAVIMLKGIEDERMVHTKGTKKKVGSRGRDKQEERKNESDESDSIGAPSTRSMLEDDMDIGDENFNDDAIGQVESGTGGPINTMQSLLFTEQVRSGSRATRGDLTDVEALDTSEQKVRDASVATTDAKLFLFPSQIRKISGLIGLLTQQRDLCFRLRDIIMKEGNGDSVFDWEAHLKHSYQPDDMEVKVQALSLSFDYGFEYQGSCQRYAVTPSCDRVILSMCQALQSHSGVAISYPNTSAPETLSELSYQLGRALYTILCTQSMDHYMLGDLFKGIAETGCWICLQRFDCLRTSLLSVAGQLAAEVQKALRASKTSITLMSEEIALSPSAACFITLDGSTKSGTVDLNCCVPAVASSLPDECMSYFRIVNVIKPDRRTVLEIQLLSQGFTQAPQLSRKLCQLLDLCGSLFSTVPLNRLQTAPNESPAKDGKLSIVYGENGFTSLPLIEHVIAGSGVSLDVLMREQLEIKQEYRDTIVSKTKRFASIWKHRSSLMSSSGGLAASSTGADDSGTDGPLGGATSSSSVEQSEDFSTQEAIQISKDREVIESDIEAMKKMEEIALVTSLRNILLPRLLNKDERSLLFTFVSDLFPAADEEVDFIVDDPQLEDLSWNGVQGGMNLEVSIPNHRAESDARPFEVKREENEPVDDVEAAVAIATVECDMDPVITFQNKVAQITELAESMRSVVVCGEAGCGKSRCVEVYAETKRQLGFDVTVEKVFVNALDSRRKLFGYFETEGREWKDGLFQQLLRPHCLNQYSSTSEQGSYSELVSAEKNVPFLSALYNLSTGNARLKYPSQPRMILLHVDGQMRTEDADIFLQLLKSEAGACASAGPVSGHVGSSSWLALPNNEHLNLPLDLRVIWEVEDLSSVAPSDLSQLGVLAFTGNEITWQVHLNRWTKNLPDAACNVTRQIIARYMPRLVSYFVASTTPSHITVDGTFSRLHQALPVSSSTMTQTFCKLMDCFLHGDASPVERERYVVYAAFWAFGGTLDADSRDMFAAWWCKTWPNSFPSGAGDPWHQFVDSDSRNFARWSDHLPQFSGASGPNGAFVHTPDASQMMHLIGALMDAGHASMLVGPLGCGKSAIVRERVNNVSSGEVAEVLSLFVHCNRLTEAGNLWKRICDHLEWKHGVSFTPRGNKKLLCMVDDLNLSRLLGTENDTNRLQSACELIRQHLDVGGVRNPATFKWQQVSNTAYVTSINPRPASQSGVMSQRMTRHFSVFSCPYPSVATQHSIFSTLLQSRILVNPGSSPSAIHDLENSKPNQHILSNITMVTVELQERLRGMYLTTPERAHYNFALGDLEKIFRNLMTSLAPGFNLRDLLLLWRHECDWIYCKRMISDVDCERYQQTLDTAMRKYFTDNKYLPVILAPKQPLFSNVRELDSGIVTAGRHIGRSSSSSSSGSGVASSHVTDYYKMATKKNEVHDLLEEALKEYNKVNVKMRLNFYDDTTRLICRLARILQSSHFQSHSVLFGDGCPAMASLIVNLSAHLGGFRVVTLPPLISSTSNNHQSSLAKLSPSSLSERDQRILRHFKQYLVQLYNSAGVKGEKIVFLLHDDKEINHECLTVIEEFVCYGAISHLFTSDEQTTIANSVRSEVTAAGLTYSKEVAWQFFLSTVTKNLRVVLICCQPGGPFMEKSLEFPSLFERMNMIAIHHWNREQLVANAIYHFSKRHKNDVSGIAEDDTNDETAGAAGGRGRRHVMDKRGQENVAHLLANMHIAVQSKNESRFYRVPGHVSNYAYEKLVERFVSVYHERRQMVKKSHEATRGALENIDRENAVAEALQKDLDREKKVLDEHKAGTLQLLAQIGQDMVITEQQVSAVKRQIKKIRHLKKTLPEYQLAHEKAVFKAAAIVADTKKVVKEIDVQALSELRSLQKPDSDVEDLMAAIIMILKSPNSDVSWSKGAKRQMANLDRFLDELSSFDEISLPVATLANLESFLEKDSFTCEALMQKSGGNTAVGSLVRWVKGVCRYHTTLLSKVKPLHEKVEQTTIAIGDAQHKLRQLDSKKEALEARLRDLADGFEQATADKNTQEEKRCEMEEHLRVAAQFRQVLTGERRRCCAVLNSYQDRLEWVTGAAAISAGFAIYLSPYPHALRRMLLTVDWPQCLTERGIPLVFDSTDPVKGHVIEFMLDVNENIQDMSPRKTSEGDAMLDAVIAASNVVAQQEEEEQDAATTDRSNSEDAYETLTSNLGLNTLPPVAEETDADDEADDVNQNEETSAEEQPDEQHSAEKRPSQPEVETTASKLSQGVMLQAYTVENLPYIDPVAYQAFLSSLIKVLVGEDVLQEWMTKDFAHHQLQNAAVMLSSWQRPPLLLDPYLAGADWCAVHLRQNRNVTPVNLAPKIETTHVTAIEKSVLGGHTLMLMDCEHHAGSLVRPLIHYANTAGRRSERSEESQTVRFLGRRLLCPDTFRLYLTTTQMTSSRFHPDVIAATQLISYVSNAETLQEDLLLRVLMRVRPDIYRERRHVARIVRQHRHTLSQLDAILCERLVTGDDPKTMENSTKFLSDVVELKATVSQKLEEAQTVLATLNNFTEALYPIAQRASLLFSTCRAVPALNIHYQIPLPFFLHLFDSSVGTDFAEEDQDDKTFVLKDVVVTQDPEVADEEEPLGDEDLEKRRKEAAARRKASLRLGSASTTMRNKKGRRVETVAEQSEDECEDDSYDTDSSAKAKSSDTEPEVKVDEDDGHLGAGSHLIIPEIVDVEETRHENLPNEKVQEIVDALTLRVFANIYSSVYPEHRLLVTALTLLNIQSDGEKPPFSEEEFALLVHGNPGFGRETRVSLADFESEATVPDWLPADRWEDILAFSVLPKPLEGVCVRVAENSDEWRSWYNQSFAEVEAFPASAAELGPLDEFSDFQRLLLVKTLRPDRYEPALRNYVNKCIATTPLNEIVNSTAPVVDIDTLFKDVSNTLGILILLPDDDEPDAKSRVAMQPPDAIRRLAEKLKVALEAVTLGDGYQHEATRCIDSALSQDCWALIHGLHLVPERFFEDLQIQLARVGNVSRSSEAANQSNGASSQAAHFQVWLTSKSHASLPSLLTQYLYKISWDSLLQLVVEDVGMNSLQLSSCSLLKSSIISTFSQIAPEVLESWRESNEKIRRVLYSVALCHAVLLARQCFGWHGSHKSYPIQMSALNQALMYAVAGNDSQSALKQIYSDVITSDTDQIYVDALFDNVSRQSRSMQGQKYIQLNDVTVPVPPPDIAPADYSSWMRNNVPDDMDSFSALSLTPSAHMWRTAQEGEKMLEQMQHLFNALQEPGYESSLLSPGSTADISKPVLSLSTMQNVLDVCSEKLPPLLELGSTNHANLKSFDFPYHPPSMLSVQELDLPHMPESIGFVLLQECVWFNRCMCTARQHLHALRSHLFATSDYMLPPELLDTAKALYAEEVPRSWQHPNEFPNTHVLLTWLDDVAKRYSQMRSWVKTGMVPVEGKTPVGPVTSIWLGGLVNPGALLMALCSEAAAAHEASMEQVRVRCAVVGDDDDVMEHTAGMYLENVNVFNCSWDDEKGCFTRDLSGDATSLVQSCPRIYFYPNILTEQEEEEEQSGSGAGRDDQKNTVEYPVYMNVSRQSFVTYFPLPSGDVTRYQQRHNGAPRAFDCGVILQSGPDLSQRDTFKSRAYLAQKRRDQWSRVSPAVSELMSRSGTRMSSARQSLSGPRMSIASLPASMTDAAKLQAGKAGTQPQADDAGIESHPQHLYPEDTFVLSEKSSSPDSSMHDSSIRQGEALPGPPQAPRTLPNGDVKHLRTDTQARPAESGTAPSGDSESDEQQPKKTNDIGEEMSPPSDGEFSDQAQLESAQTLEATDQSTEDGQQMEREGSLLQTILADEQTTEDEEN